MAAPPTIPTSSPPVERSAGCGVARAGSLAPLQLQQALASHYAGSEWVSVEAPSADGKLEPMALNDTNKMELRVFGNDAFNQAVLIARLDNLGKGASGAAVQSMNVHLGLDEGLGL